MLCTLSVHCGYMMPYPLHKALTPALCKGFVKTSVTCRECIRGVLGLPCNNRAFLWTPASRDTQSFLYRPTRASSAGSPTVTRCMPSSGTTGRRRRSSSTLSTASCCGYVSLLPDQPSHIPGRDAPVGEAVQTRFSWALLCVRTRELI